MTAAGTRADPYEKLAPLMRLGGATCAPRDFFEAVQRAYHAAESRDYDALHADMFDGLAPVWARLLRHAPPGPLRFLDVGAGTGLVGGFLDRLAPGRVRELILLDPSPEMLARAREKAARWEFPCRFVEGTLDALGADERFDVLTANSVLHHIVEIEPFCAAFARHVAPNGVFLAAQDPRAGAANDPVLLGREEEARRRREGGLARGALRLLVRAKRLVVGRRGEPLAAATCAPLLRDGVLRRPLDLKTIWAITDFHVPGQPGGVGEGIDPARVDAGLGLSRADLFTYQFFGLSWNLLDGAEQARERRWLADSDAHGKLFAGAWRA